MDDKKAKDTSNIIREIKFDKDNKGGKVHVIEADTMAFLVEFKPEEKTINFWYQGHKYDFAVFDSLLEGTACFYGLVSTMMSKFERWRSKWIPKQSN